MTEPLTERQQKILTFIKKSIQDNGYPPTIREIGEAFGIRSTNGVNDHLKALERKGYLLRGELKSRALSVIDGGASPGFSQKPTGRFQLVFTASMMAQIAHESSQTLPAENNSLAFQLFIRALDRDDADQQILGEHPERRQRSAGLHPSLGNLPLDAIHNLLVKRAVRRRGNGTDDQFFTFVVHVDTVYSQYAQ